MSKHNNANKNNYTERGRERQGDDVLHEVNKQQFAQAQKAKELNSLVPNQNQNHNEVPASGDGENNAGNATISANSSSGDY